MPDIASILWAGCAVAVVPLIWWLHRTFSSRNFHLVPALFLWPEENPDQQQIAAKRRPHPVWMLRAAIGICLALAAGGLNWIGAEPKIMDVWFDDTPSMTVVENGAPRWRLASNKLLEELSAYPVGAGRLRSLTRSGLSIRFVAKDIGGLTERLAKWFETDSDIAAPKNASLVQNRGAADGDVWLVTDGAHPDLKRWMARMSVTHVIQAGSTSENVMISRIVERAPLDGMSARQGIVEIRNLGRQVQRRKLSVTAGKRQILDIALSIPAGFVELQTFRLPDDGALPLVASLAPTDASAWDDSLSLETGAPGPLGVAVDPSCGAALRVAIETHPLLSLESPEGRRGGIGMVCGTVAPVREGTTIWFRRDGRLVNLKGSTIAVSPEWEVGEIFQAARTVPAYRADNDSGQGRVLVGDDKFPLVTLYQTNSGRQIVVRIDIQSPAFVNQPGFPLLVSRLVEISTNGRLPDRIALVERSAAPSLIAPVPLKATLRPTRALSHLRTTDLTEPLLVLALLLIAADCCWLMMRRRRSQPRANV